MKLKMDGRKIKCIIPALFLICIGAANLFAQESRVRPRESEAALEAFSKAELLTEEDFEYDLTRDGNGIRLTKYLGNSTCIRIPDEIEEMPVTELAGNLLESNNYNELEVIVFPDSVETICALNNAKKLKFVRLPGNLKMIPSYEFAGCYSLEKIYIPDSVKVIESNAFSNSGLKEIDFPDDAGLKSSVCSGCNQLQKVHLPSNLDTIPYWMFSDCESLVSIEIPETVTSIGYSSFRNCTSLTSITLPQNLKTIESYAFNGCESISEIIIPDGVEELGYSFIGGTSVKNLYVPDSVIKFGYEDGWEPGDCRYNERGNENGHIIIGKSEYESLRIPDWITEIKNIPAGTKIINFPMSLKKCYLSNSSSLEYLEDIIIPDSLRSVKFSDGWYDSAADFSSAKLPIKTQKRLRELGYTENFGGTRPAKKTGQ